ncbi:hypothetical protein N7535_001233 [Penicillium sp. DV-2018c]|nr:hypothetical protein N7535_001233 [Penicillium sp. DV-2018c]
MEEGSRSKKSSPSLAKNTTTQDPDTPFAVPSTPKRGSMSFAPLPPPTSPGSAKSSRSSETTFAYKDRNFIIELEVRGVFESEEAPSDLASIVKMLKRKSPGLQSLDELTTETFDNCRIVPGNEPTIQTVIVPGLINLHGIIRNNTTHAAIEAKLLSSGC